MVTIDKIAWLERCCEDRDITINDLESRLAQAREELAALRGKVLVIADDVERNYGETDLAAELCQAARGSDG